VTFLLNCENLKRNPDVKSSQNFVLFVICYCESSEVVVYCVLHTVNYNLVHLTASF
jgi:hypothetical protein